MSTTSLQTPSAPRPHPFIAPWIAVFAWAAAALALGGSGALSSLPPAVVPGLIWGPVVIAVLLARREGRFRAWLVSVDLRLIVWSHVGRVYFGIMFLIDAGLRVPEIFARVAGPGDILVGILALPAGFLAADPAHHKRWLFAWNLVAFFDILIAFATAQKLLFITPDPRMKTLLTGLPYAALPLFVVPFILMSHALLFWRLGRQVSRNQ